MIDKYFTQLKIILLGFDVFSFALAFFLANRVQVVWTVSRRKDYFLAAIVSIVVILYVFRYLGLYKMKNSFLQESLRVTKGTGIAFFIILGLSFFYRYYAFSRLFFIYLAIFFLIISLINRGLFRRLIKFFGNIKPIQRITLIVGCGVTGKTLIDDLLLRPSVWRVAGFLDDDAAAGAYRDIPSLGPLSRLGETIAKDGITDVVIAIPSAPREVIKGLIANCDALNVNWRVVPNLYDLPLDDVHIDRLENLPLVGSKTTNIIGINQLIKRVFDLLLSSLIIAITLPFMAVIAIAIRLTSPGPALFRQERVGLNGRPFVFLKFRTMYVNSDDQVHRDYVAKWIKDNDLHNKDAKGRDVFKIDRDPRVTTVGYWLRKFSLDELPQLFNVWKGDMSLVGPRPPLPYEVKIYEDWQKKRLQAPPGLTGLWQVSGRNYLSFEEMVRLDISYINNWSVENDIKIILKTIAILLFSKGH
jgi:exopolysaccharide biosynthesis polyprenyl glycosylphosphotransferase